MGGGGVRRGECERSGIGSSSAVRESSGGGWGTEEDSSEVTEGVGREVDSSDISGEGEEGGGVMRDAGTDDRSLVRIGIAVGNGGGA